jgi:hypothetical protein
MVCLGDFVKSGVIRVVSETGRRPAPTGGRSREKGMVEQFSAIVHGIWSRLSGRCREFLQQVGMSLATYLELNQESQPDRWRYVRYLTLEGDTGAKYSNCMSSFLTVGAPRFKKLAEKIRAYRRLSYEEARHVRYFQSLAQQLLYVDQRSLIGALI